MSENTAYVAERIKTGMSAHLKEGDSIDLIRISSVKAYPDSGSSKFFWGGKSAVMKEKPELQPYQFDADKYERIIIATPVWAWTMSPPIRTFIDANRDRIKDKQIGVFVCSGGGGAKAVGKIRQYLQVFPLCLSYVNPFCEITICDFTKIISLVSHIQASHHTPRLPSLLKMFC